MEPKLDRITADAAVCSGASCIRGMRVRVKDLLDLLNAGATRQEILADITLPSRAFHSASAAVLNASWYLAGGCGVLDFVKVHRDNVALGYKALASKLKQFPIF